MHIQDWQTEKMNKLDLQFWKETDTDYFVLRRGLSDEDSHFSCMPETGISDHLNYKVMMNQISELWNYILPWTKEHQEALGQDKTLRRWTLLTFIGEWNWKRRGTNRSTNKSCTNTKGYNLKQHQNLKSPMDLLLMPVQMCLTQSQLSRCLKQV